MSLSFRVHPVVAEIIASAILIIAGRLLRPSVQSVSDGIQASPTTPSPVVTTNLTVPS